MVESLLRQAFMAGFERYGDLNFDWEFLAAHIRSICAKYTGSGEPAALEKAVDSLHVCDLYLCLGCAGQNGRAWQCFAAGFHGCISRLAASFSGSDQEATELTDSVIVDLYLPDRSGRSRIASFDGRSSLATWLRVIVSRRAANQRKRSRHQPLGVEHLPETADDGALLRLDAELREHRYGDALHEALRRACAALSERERLVLRLRFCETRKVQEIATRLHVHPSNITRQIERVCERLRATVIRTLGERYHLSASQIDECLSDVVENPRYSVLALLEQNDRTVDPYGTGWPAVPFVPEAVPRETERA